MNLILSQCKNCDQDFTISYKDLAFYEKIGSVMTPRVQIPPPILCPDCRQQRRAAWRNERTIYHRHCDFCKKKQISIYPENAQFPVYCNECWWSDKWNPLKYGRDFDFNCPFFPQYKDLQQNVPRLAIYLKNVENSEYCNHSARVKNCYLGVSNADSEDIYYSTFVIKSRNITDSYRVEEIECCYENMYCEKNFQTIFAILSENCSKSAFLYDCKSCNDCFMCWNLRHKQYCIRNKQYSKEAYESEMEKIHQGSYSALEKDKKEFFEILQRKAIKKHQNLINCEKSNGDFLRNCKNTHDSFEVSEAEDCRYCYESINLKDVYDTYETGFSCELQYDTHATDNGTRVLFGHVSYEIDSGIYIDSCHNSANIFGCISLKRNEYCILNKQYSKEEYENLIPKIIEHMKGEWGEFFPISCSPYGYNETAAEEQFPITKKEAQKNGWKWKESDPLEYKKQTYEIPDDIEKTPDAICKEMLGCIDCDKNYKIIAQELKLYRQLNLPVPRKCPKCRHKDRIFLRNKRMLYKRNCQKCGKEIQSPYEARSKEVIYCEECYLKTVY